MYQEFFSLKEQPFSISPDPDFLFLSERHKEALAHLQYGLQGNGGFVLLTGEVGTGKTTVCRSLLQNLSTDTDIAFILNPALTEIELLATVCDEFKIEYDKDKTSLKLLFDALTAWMMNNHLQGRSAIVLIDEAQHLSFSVLEQLRLLTNIESNNKKPLQVILIGQTELQQKLKQTELRQLAQRITARYHLLPLSRQESEYYILHRLNVAGARFPIFERNALKHIYKSSQGIPRLINLLCDRCLLCAYTQNVPKVTVPVVKKACVEMELSENNGSFIINNWRITTLIVLCLLTGIQAPQILARFNDARPAAAAEQESPLLEEVKQVSEPEIQAPPVKQAAQWFDAYPDLQLSNASFDNALLNLYAVWGYQADIDTVDCGQGEGALLSCYSINSSLKKLKKLNYPSIIKLENNAQDSLYAVLYKISDKYQLLIDGQVIRVSESWFNQYWTGNLTLLWQAPFAEQKVLKFGQQNEQVAWLVTQLNKVQGLAREDKDRFDLQLLQQVSTFQRAQGLSDDGLVGFRTMMPLMQLANPELPRLMESSN
ncbi:AAA family ATPase [Psychromonas aquimarina]|uniref:AAA family ATPase n=1 Tax=Psychromonas aquimarina TaxID=444919 RepID=UPI00041A74C9|nr:AAA family ATPase [Psychromonas aquimarina]